MQKEKKDKHFIQKPVYEGGPKAMRAFISQNLRYPKEALQHKIEGTVSLNFTINYQGKVTDVKIVSGLGYGCDEEAIRVVKLLKFQVAKTRKIKVKFQKNLNIHFRKPKTKTVKRPDAPQQINYNYVSSTNSKAETASKKPEKKSGGGYTYTINF